MQTTMSSCMQLEPETGLYVIKPIQNYKYSTNQHGAMFSCGFNALCNKKLSYCGDSSCYDKISDICIPNSVPNYVACSVECT